MAGIIEKPKKKKLVQCDLCPQMCDKTGWHDKAVPEGYSGQYRHNVHLYRHHANEPIIQGNYFQRQEEKRLRELQMIVREINSVPVGEEFLKTLDKD